MLKLTLIASAFLMDAIVLIIINNPVISVILLMLVFIKASVLIIVLNLDFLGILLILIYVGALAVLFVFVVMMLNIKITESMRIVPTFLPLTVYVAIIYIYIIDYIVYTSFCFNNIANFTYKSWISLLDNQPTIYSLGLRIWEHGNALIILASLLLLFSMIAAIMLTLKPKEKPHLSAEEERNIRLFKVILEDQDSRYPTTNQKKTYNGSV